MLSDQQRRWIAREVREALTAAKVDLLRDPKSKIEELISVTVETAEHRFQNSAVLAKI